MAILRLIRWPNLLIVALTQSLIYFQLLLPVYDSYQMSPHLSPLEFLFLSLVTVLISACGYIINDVLDQQIDQINKPESRIIGVQVEPQTAYWFYSIFGFIGFFIAIFLGFITENVEWISIYPFSFVLLYLYSYKLKKRPLLGNLLVSLFCAGVAGIILLAEGDALVLLNDMSPQASLRVKTILIWYMVFAFLSTLFRELVKDMEDIEGDLKMDCRTAPIAWGLPKTKLLAIFTALLLSGLLSTQLFYYREIFNQWALGFSTLFILLPLIFACYRLWFASGPKQYHLISQLSKLIMLNGLLLLLFIA